MYDLITATKCLNLLRERDDIKYSKSYFSQMVSDGKIPSHSKHGSPKKFFKYEEVRQSIEDSKDPTRDAQREANNKLKTEPATLLDVEGSYSSRADMTDEERVAEEVALKEAADAKREAMDAGVPDKPRGEHKSDMPESITQAMAKAEKEYWLGRKAELDFKKMNEELISVEEVKRQAFEMARSVRDVMISIPSRLSPILASENDQHKIQSTLTKEINAALESLTYE